MQSQKDDINQFLLMLADSYVAAHAVEVRASHTFIC